MRYLSGNLATSVCWRSYNEGVNFRSLKAIKVLVVGGNNAIVSLFPKRLPHNRRLFRQNSCVNERVRCLQATRCWTSAFIVPNFIWAVAICPNFNVCNAEWNSSNLPDGSPKFEWSCSDYQIRVKLFQFAQMFLIVCKFQLSNCILEVQKVNKAVRSYPKLNKDEDFPLGPDLSGAIAIWPELIYSFGIYPKFSQFIETFPTSPKFEWSCPNLPKFYWDR